VEFFRNDLREFCAIESSAFSECQIKNRRAREFWGTVSRREYWSSP
jgi:hypothetical protein